MAIGLNCKRINDFCLKLENDAGALRQEVERCIEKEDYDSLIDIGAFFPHAIVFPHARDAINLSLQRMAHQAMDNLKKGKIQNRYDQGLINALIKLNNSSHQLLRGDFSHYSVLQTLADEIDIAYMSMAENDSYFEDYLNEKKDLKDKDIFRLLLKNHTRVSNELCSSLISELINHFVIAKEDNNQNAIDDISERFQYLCDNMAGFKSFVVKNFVTSTPPLRRVHVDVFSANYFKVFKDFTQKFHEIRNFNADAYLFVLNELEKSNQSETQRLKKAGHAEVFYFEQNPNGIRTEINRINSLPIHLYKNENFTQALKRTLKDIDGLETAAAIVANQQGEFEVQHFKLKVAQDDGLDSLPPSYIVKTLVKDKTLGVYKEIDKEIRPSCPEILANPLGGLDGDKKVIEQVTPHMMRVLLMALMPGLRNSVGGFVDLGDKNLKAYNKVGDCKILAKELALLRDNGVPIVFREETQNDVSIAGFVSHRFNDEDNLLATLNSPELVKELTKVGLANGYIDAVNNFCDAIWTTQGSNWSLDVKIKPFKKLMALFISEGVSGKTGHSKDFLGVTLKLFCSYLDYPNIRPNENYLFDSAVELQQAFKDIGADSLLDKNVVSPIIRAINKMNDIKITQASSPIFIQNGDGFEQVGDAIRHQHYEVNRKKVENNILDNFAILYNGPIMDVEPSINRVRKINERMCLFFNGLMPTQFFEGDNVKPLVQGKDGDGNNILHHLLQNPKMFFTPNDMLAEIDFNAKYSKDGGKWIDVEKQGVVNDLIAVGCDVDKMADLSNIAKLVEQIPEDEFKRLALEKNNAGRTPLEELCYFAEFIKERANASFAISKKYQTLLKNVIDITQTSIDASLKVIEKTPAFFEPEGSGRTNNLNNLIAQEKEEPLRNVLRYLGATPETSLNNDFHATIKRDELPAETEYNLVKMDNRIKNTMNKLPTI